MGELKRPSGFAQYKHQAHTRSEIFNHCNIFNIELFWIYCIFYGPLTRTTYEYC